MQRLAALVPRPRLHLIPFDRLRAGRFHGVLALKAKLRSEIIPSPAEHATEHSASRNSASPTAALSVSEKRPRLTKGRRMASLQITEPTG